MATEGSFPVSESSSLHKSFFDNTPDGLAYCEIVLDTRSNPVDFLYIGVNKNFEKLTGLKGVVGKRATETIPGLATSNPELFEIYGRVALTGGSEKFETYIASLSRWFFISVYSPKKKFFVAVFQNINGRKQIEKNLENARIAARNVLEDLSTEKSKVEIARAKEEAILMSIGDGLIAADEKGNIMLVNKTAERLLGKKSEEVTGKDFCEIIPIEDEEGSPILLEKRPIRMALLSGKTITTTTTGPAYYYVRNDKTKFPVAITVTPVIFDGKVIGTIEVFRDITKEKEVDRAKTEFVSLASHQLRTPLSSVRWYSEMLLDGDAGALSAKQKQYLEEVRRGNLRMIDLVNTLLHISRLELGMARVHVESVQLSKVVTEVLQDLESHRQKQDISVKVQIPPSLSPLMTDRSLVRIVVENLISNAIKYTPAQGTIKIAVEEVPQGGHFDTQVADEKSIGFSVVDNGIGIPLDQQSRIFEKLFRAENVHEVDTDGAGLGLYLTKLVLGRMKGQIWFTSHPGKGTAFYVLLPRSGLKQKL